MKYDVFISYSRKDYVDDHNQIIPENIISQLKELFDQNNISYWLDEQGLSGQEFTSLITRKIKESSIFLFVSSKNSNASIWTRNEIGVANHHKKIIIPFRYDNSTFDDSVIMYIISLDHIEYYKNPEKGMSRLLLSIQGYIKEEIDAKEKERQERERLRQAEILRKEKSVRLQNLREKIESLENRKLQIEREILLQEESLNDLFAGEEHLAEDFFDVNEYELRCSNQEKYLQNIHDEFLSRERSSGVGKQCNLISKEEEILSKVRTSYVGFLHRTRDLLRKYSTIVIGWMRKYDKRYWFHLLLILCLSISLWIAVSDVLAALGCGYLHPSPFAFCLFCFGAILGVVQLLKAKKNGFLTLIFDAILVYTLSSVSGGVGIIADGYVPIFMAFCLTIYLVIIFCLYLIHKTDKKSILSWDKLQDFSIKRPALVLSIVALISVMLSLLIPYGYAKHCGLKIFTVEDICWLSRISIEGLLGNERSAYEMGDVYSHERGYRIYGEDGEAHDHYYVDRNLSKALWWYELADYQYGITKCKQHMEVEKLGFLNSSIYGRCGINKYNNEIVKINIANFKADSLVQNLNYHITLLGAKFEHGKLEIEGAYLRDSSTIHAIYGDVVVIRFVQDSLVSERVIPVKRVDTQFKYNSAVIIKDESFIVNVENAIPNAQWEIEGNVRIQEAKENELCFIPADEKDVCVKYVVDGKIIISQKFHNVNFDKFTLVKD